MFRAQEEVHFSSTWLSLKLAWQSQESWEPIASDSRAETHKFFLIISLLLTWKNF